VRGVFASARTRRRLTWLGALALIAAAIAGLVLLVPGPKPSPEAKLSNTPIAVTATPKVESFAPKKKQVIQTAMKFVQTAVARHNIGASWDLVTPSLKKGYTKSRWASGRDLPVVNYPVVFATWHLAYSYSDEVDIQVALFAHRRQTRAQVFDITLNPVREQHQTRWLVSSFLPTPAEGGGIGGNATPASLKALRNGPRSPQISKVWLLVPVSIFGLLLLVLAALGVRGWRAGRVYRAYARR
jgi:hypothetical protein